MHFPSVNKDFQSRGYEGSSDMYLLQIYTQHLNKETGMKLNKSCVIFNPNLPNPVNFVPFGTMRYTIFDINLMSITGTLGRHEIIPLLPFPKV